MKAFPLLFLFLTGLTQILHAQWPSDPGVNLAVAVMPGEEAIPKVVSLDDGSTYIGWFSYEEGNYNVRLQMFDQEGIPQWMPEGLLVSNHPSMTWLTDWDMVADAEGGVILAFQDIRTGNNDMFIYKISSDAEFIWGEDGIQLTNDAAFDVAPSLAVTSLNNTVIAWQADNVVRLQKLSPSGETLWPGGITLSGTNTFSWPQLIPAGNDEIILKYFEDSGPVWAPTRHVFAMRYDAGGNEAWPQPAVISDAGGISAWTQIFSIVSDGQDGFFIAWHDDRDNNNLASAFVQHIDAGGTPLFTPNGLEVSTMLSRNHFYPHLSFPSQGTGLYVFWNEMDPDQNNRGIYAQKISQEGSLQWGSDGKALIEISPQNVYPFASGSTSENAVLFYEEFSGEVNSELRSMMIDADGNFVWEEGAVSICTVQSEKVHPVAGPLKCGQWILAWEDNRNGGRDIYAQNLKPDGTTGPLPQSDTLIIWPDTLVFDEWKIDTVYVFNPGSDPVTIDTAWFDPEYFVFFKDYPNPQTQPFTVQPYDTLAFAITPPLTQELWEWFEVHLWFQTSVGLFDVFIWFDDDILGQKRVMDPRTPLITPLPAGTFCRITFPERVTEATATIYSLSGQPVAELNCSGRKEIFWDLKDSGNRKVKPGIYFVVIPGEEFIPGKIIVR
ncbi:MAG: hypothetical protein Kow00127_18690 [Bacteroidales bacterium]